jgi:excisionase family DNA binding protein
MSQNRFANRITLTVLETCEVSGLSQSTVHKMIAQELIKAIRVGGRVMIVHESLIKALTEGAPIRSSGRRKAAKSQQVHETA